MTQNLSIISALALESVKTLTDEGVVKHHSHHQMHGLTLSVSEPDFEDK